MSYTASIANCAECGQGIDADHDLDDERQRYYELHLQSCALAVQKRIADALERIAADGLLMRMEGRLPESAPEHFHERAQAFYDAARSPGDGGSA